VNAPATGRGRRCGPGCPVPHTADALVIEVSDDGGGPADRPAYEGHGLAGMRERVAMYGGELVTGRTTDGYRVAATFRTGQAVA
jgi:glucose-6-phosphate-specific signal transduction histidine kinase